MSTIHAQNWDGATPPAMPAGWKADPGLVTDAGLGRSGPASLTTNAMNATSVAYRDAPHVNGNVRVSAGFRLSRTAGTGGRIGMVIARAPSAPSPWASNTCYVARLDAVGAVDGATFQVQRRVAGVATDLSRAVSLPAWDAAGWYRIILECAGPIVTGWLQRDSDSRWLVGGAWQVARAPAFGPYGDGSPIDATMPSYAGLLLLRANATAFARSDDFSFEALDVAPAATRASRSYPSGFLRGVCRGVS